MKLISEIISIPFCLYPLTCKNFNFSVGIKVTPPSSFDDLDDINQKRYDEKSAFLEPKSDEDIIREHISAKNKGKYSTKDGKRRGDRPSSVASDSAKFKAPSLDLDLPPPPSPPCTCGKNLPILPPESMPPEINLMHGYMDGKNLCSISNKFIYIK